MGRRYPHSIVWGSESEWRQTLLNVCLCFRALRAKFRPKSPSRRRWHALLKARQLQLLILRTGQDVHAMRDRGWLEKSENGSLHPLEQAAIERMLELRDRMLRAVAAADEARREILERNQQSRLAEAA